MPTTKEMGDFWLDNHEVCKAWIAAVIKMCATEERVYRAMDNLPSMYGSRESSLAILVAMGYAPTSDIRKILSPEFVKSRLD